MTPDRAFPDLSWEREALDRKSKRLEYESTDAMCLSISTGMIAEVLRDCDRPTRIAFSKAFRAYVERITAGAKEAVS